VAGTVRPQPRGRVGSGHRRIPRYPTGAASGRVPARRASGRPRHGHRCPARPREIPDLWGTASNTIVRYRPSTYGALLAFFFRQPAVDEDEQLLLRQSAELDEPIIRQVRAAREAGALRSDSPEWWGGSAVYALVYVAWEGMQRGWLARLDAPELVLRTLLRGEGAPDGG
jgi:hypothetical protein